VSIPLSTTKGGARWKTSSSSQELLVFHQAEGIRGLMGEKGLMEEEWNDRSNWRKKII